MEKTDDRAYINIEDYKVFLKKYMSEQPALKAEVLSKLKEATDIPLVSEGTSDEIFSTVYDIIFDFYFDAYFKEHTKELTEHIKKLTENLKEGIKDEQ
tara:strand:- start:582 stop:875 length:294 start_codon:yes stop_codon:yes gene_type:complete